MGVISLPTTFVDGTIPTAAQFNGDFSTVVSEFNGNITNANISADAAIVSTKIAGTAATLTGTERLTNKTISGLITADSDGATITFDLNTSNIHKVTLGGNRTLALSNATVGQVFVLRLTQDGTGSRTVTWFSTINWAGGSAPALTTTLNKTDVFGFICTAANVYDGFIVGLSL
jgi:hypothetical protein